MKKNQRWLVVIVGILIIAILFIVIFLDKRKSENTANFIYKQNQAEESAQTDVDNNLITNWEDGQVAQNAPSGIQVPGVDAVVPEGLEDILAIPDEVVQVAPGSSANLRIFKIRGEDNKFKPYQIIAKYNDTVHIDITAIDKDYDFVIEGYNMKQSVEIGSSKALEFQAIKSGRFLYYCDTCGGGVDAGAYGEIIIVE